MTSTTPQASEREGGVGCPRCSAPLRPRAAECPSCHLPLLGPLAGRLWTLDQEIASLVAARGQVLAALADTVDSTDGADHASGALAASAALAGTKIAPVPLAPPPAGAQQAPPIALPEPDPHRRRLGTQQLLLVAGVVLVVAAAGAFAAAVWEVIGVLGQAVVLLAVCVAAAAASRSVARRGLVASAEALAVLSVGVLAVMAGSARHLDLLGLADVRESVYVLSALLLIVLVCAAADRLVAVVVPPMHLLRPDDAPDPHPQPEPHPEPHPEPRGRRPVPRSFVWVAVLLTAALPTSLMVAVRGAGLTWAAAAIVLALACAVAEPAARRRAAGLGSAVLIVGAPHLLGAVITLLGVVLTDSRDPHVLGAGAQFALLAIAAAALTRRTRTTRPAMATLARSTAWTGAGGAFVALAVTGTAVGLPLLAALLAVGAGVVVLTGARLPWSLVVAAQVLAGGALLAVPLVDSVDGTHASWACPPAWALLAASTWVTGRRRPLDASASSDPASSDLASSDPASSSPPSPWLQQAIAYWFAASALAALLGASLIPGPVERTARLAAVLAVSTGLLALAARHRGRSAAVEGVLAAGWALGAAIALVVAGSPPDASGRYQVVLAVSGLAALAYAVLPGATLASTAGTPLLASAWWVHLGVIAAQPGRALEWWTVPPAVLALAVGAAASRRAPRVSTWWTLGPGLLLGLVPSALMAGGSASPWRAVVTLAAAVVVCAAGLQRSAQAPVVVGATAALLVGVEQVWGIAVGAPLWASLGLAGLALLVLAIRIEHARRDAQRVRSWLGALQ